jgi:MFS family permease
VLLYLVVTMAPFAVLAPFIGPALDRLQHGRRWTMATTAIGRAILAIIMAGHPSELLVLYPCALGSLVLSKAYAVVRAAAAPRLVPPGMTLTQANARLTIFGLASTLVLGGHVGVVIKTTGSYTAGLWLTAVGFAVCAYFAFRLPKQIDSSVSGRRHPGERARPRGQQRTPPITRLRAWAKRGFDAYLVIALQGESALRLLSGLLTIYLAFYVEGTAHGYTAAWQLGGVIAAAGLGNFAGTAIGTRWRMGRPEAVIVGAVVFTAVFCVIVALIFTIVFAIVGMFVSATMNALSKIALDALIQRDVVETLRSSAFARSETFLQLAWVVGAAIGVVLPSGSHSDGAIGFWVAVAIVGLTAIVVALRLRALGKDGRINVGMSPAATTAAHLPPHPAPPPGPPPPPRSDAGNVDFRKTRPY